MSICPVCGEGDGFHDEAVHSSRPLPPGKSLPLLDPVTLCRSCGEPLDEPGAPGCRYPKHKEEA